MKSADMGVISVIVGGPCTPASFMTLARSGFPTNALSLPASVAGL